MIGGLAIALAAACCYELAYILQALEARRAGDGEALEPTLLARLLRRPRWLGGTALSGAGAVLQVFALTLAPLTLVQPALALGLVLLLALSARILGEPVGRREALAVALVIGGVAVVALAGPPAAGRVDDPAAALALVALLALPLLAPFVLRGLRDARLRVLAAAAGDALAAVALKLVADALDRGALGLALVCAAGAALAGLLALTAEMSALQRIAAVRVAPVVLAAQVLVPVLAAPLALGESWRGTPLGGGLLALAVLAVAAGAALLGSAPAVGGVIAADEREHEVGGDRQSREAPIG